MKGINKCFSLELSSFHGRIVPKEGKIVGYGAIIQNLTLTVPIPKQLAFVSDKKRQSENDEWKTLSNRYLPDSTLYKQLVFALKYEGINLLVFKKIFESVSKELIQQMVQQEALGQYSRRIWFLYEWLMDDLLDIADLKTGNLVPLLEEKLQYGIKGKSSPRHKVINNLPGTKNFCPLISKTEKLKACIDKNLSQQKNSFLNRVHADTLQRASAYLLLKDSKASFTIEGEKPRSNRAARWGQAIGQAGVKNLDKEELIRLQELVIESKRFTKMGLREQEGFIGDRDRNTQEPLPEHISAKHQDLIQLMDGWIATKNLLLSSEIDPVLAAAKMAFGFVFMHPFVDGNGRIHRYIIHHILAKMNYTEQGMIFPVSASILSHINDYQKVLSAYSLPVLEHIEWKTAPDKNVEILNETADYYKYFDATLQAEFLYDCVTDTIENIIPAEVDYLQRYDEFKTVLDEEYEMPDSMVSLLVGFLEQGSGKLSKRVLKKEFLELSKKEVSHIEKTFQELFDL